MAKFASNSDNKRELTESEIAQGFGVCGSEGMTADSEHLNSAIAYVEEYAEELIKEESKKSDKNTSKDITAIKKLVESLRIPVGAIFETTVNYKNGKEVAKALGYGEWERFGQGRVSVGISKESTAPNWTKTMGATKGEYEHKLTIAEMPSHSHEWKDYGSLKADGGVFEQGKSHWLDAGVGQLQGTTKANNTGGDQAHNNVQPSIVVGKWVRTA